MTYLYTDIPVHKHTCTHEAGDIFHHQVLSLHRVNCGQSWVPLLYQTVNVVNHQPQDPEENHITYKKNRYSNVNCLPRYGDLNESWGNNLKWPSVPMEDLAVFLSISSSVGYLYSSFYNQDLLYLISEIKDFFQYFNEKQ